MSGLRPRFLALVGGSGSGKSWLARHLPPLLGPAVRCLAVDSFYRDLSHLPPGERARFNFDAPAALDWPWFEEVLKQLAQGLPAEIPRYDYASHTRLPGAGTLAPAPLIVLDGLWLPPDGAARSRLDLVVYVECPEAVRLARRLARDVGERGRSPESVRQQWRETVQPMHERHVAPQRHSAHLVLSSPPSPEALADFLARARRLTTPEGEPSL